MGSAPLEDETMSEPSGWFPVVTLILGFAMKWLSDLVQHRRTLGRERAARFRTSYGRDEESCRGRCSPGCDAEFFCTPTSTNRHRTQTA
jgi:hypothetical protein